MNKSGSKAQPTHRKVQASTTLNRKYVKAPTAKLPIAKNADGYRVNSQLHRPVVTAMAPTPNELKNQAIAKALRNAATIEEPKRPKFGLGRILLALSCATITVLTIVYFVNLNMPNFSLRVAAMQTGIEAVYPSYIPYGFSLKSITSEDKKITINFIDTKEQNFTLTEKKSSWDSNTLLNNYVKNNYQDYVTIREQGLTIFMTANKATWVSGGIIYEVVSDVDSLSQKQMKSIAVSL